jgi:hypothetical protein
LLCFQPLPNTAAAKHLPTKGVNMQGMRGASDVIWNEAAPDSTFMTFSWLIIKCFNLLASLALQRMKESEKCGMN